MLITANLPINRDKFAQEDQILTITGATWSDYQGFESQEYPGYRVSYLNGEITIVSPGRNHERIAEVINRLIIAYCEIRASRFSLWTDEIKCIESSRKGARSCLCI